MKEAILYEIKISQMAIQTYQKMIDNYMDHIPYNAKKYNQKIIDMHQRIIDTEIIIKKLRHIILVSELS